MKGDKRGYPFLVYLHPYNNNKSITNNSFQNTNITHLHVGNA